MEAEQSRWALGSATEALEDITSMVKTLHDYGYSENKPLEFTVDNLQVKGELKIGDHVKMCEDGFIRKCGEDESGWVLTEIDNG